MSGLICPGCWSVMKASLQHSQMRGLLQRVVERIQEGIEFTQRPDKFLYGTDWPLAPMAVYRDFVRQMFPAEYHQAVFHDNAKGLFKL